MSDLSHAKLTAVRSCEQLQVLTLVFCCVQIVQKEVLPVV